MSAPARCRTLLVEDQTLFRSFLARLVRDHERLELVGETGDGQLGWELCEKLRPEVIVLDLNLPGLDGLHLAERALAALPGVRILALTSRRDEHTLSRVMALDLAGYVEKDQPIEILEAALHAIAEGGAYFTPMVQAMRRQIAAAPGAFTKLLGEREIDVLRRVAAGESSKEIADKLGLSIRTVESHRYRSMRKLELRSVAEVVEFAVKHGLHTIGG